MADQRKKAVQRSTTNPEAAEKDLIDGDPLGGGARLLRPPELDEAGAPHQDAPDLTPEISCPTPNYRQAAKTPKPRPIYNSGASPLPSPAGSAAGEGSGSARPHLVDSQGGRGEESGGGQESGGSILQPPFSHLFGAQQHLREVDLLVEKRSE
jgi:hypothetical protein